MITVGEAIRIISHLSNLSQTLNYPILTYRDLLKKMRKVTIDNKIIDLEEESRIIPASYFPIMNEVDLVDKATDLCREILSGRTIIPFLPDPRVPLIRKEKETEENITKEPATLPYRFERITGQLFEPKSTGNEIRRVDTD
jgi:hypothetical protein